MKGTVYLIHFDSAYTTASGRKVWHYLGWALNVEGRLFHHKSGTGARLLRAVNAAGIGYRIVREWHNQDRHFERWLKNRKKSRCFCPVCRGEKPRLSQFVKILFSNLFYSHHLCRQSKP